MGVVFALALIFNYIWEMLQMPLYQDMQFGDPKAWMLCFKASVGDALFSIAVFSGGAMIFRTWDWVQRLTLLKVIFLFLTGTAAAISIEIAALERGRWAYTELMPLIPIVSVGLVPVLQLIILPWVSFKTALFFRRTASPSTVR